MSFIKKRLNSLNLKTVVIMLSATLVLASMPAVAEEIDLKDAVELFFRNNYDLLISKYEVDKAYADYVASQLYPNPNLSINHVGTDFSGASPKFNNNTQMSVRIDQLIEMGGRKQMRINSAEESVASTELSQKDKIRSLLSGFYSVWYNLFLDKINVEFSKKDLERLDKVLKIADIRFKAGTLTLIDNTKLRLSRIDIVTAQTNFDNQYKNHLEDFNLLMGGEKKLEPSSKPNGQEPPRDYTEEALLNVAYKNRYDFLALQKQLKASEWDLSVAQSWKIPDITVGAQYDSFGSQLMQPYFGAGISMNIPVFNRNQGEIMRRMANRAQVETQIEKNRRQINSDVKQALNNYMASSKIAESYEDKKNDMADLLKRSEKAFSKGGITVLDYLDAQRTYRDFSTKHHQASVQVLLNRELLKVATGEIK